MKILRIAGIVAALCVMSQAQGIRFGDAVPSQTVVRIPGTSPLVIAVIPNASISFCSAPANAVPCTNKAQTYSDITLTSTCPTGTQVVLNGTSSCVGSSDSLGNWGVWVPVGSISTPSPTSKATVTGHSGQHSQAPQGFRLLVRLL
jgi:hypothetical protein